MFLKGHSPFPVKLVELKLSPIGAPLYHCVPESS